MMMRMLCMLLLCCIELTVRGEDTPKLNRDDFPKDFIFGSGTSAYQVEGAAAEDGRTPSIWDTAAHADNERDIGADGYHKYKEDIKLMKEMGLEGYRFSISWSRLIPNGRGDVNPLGLKYYNNFINELIDSGIQPHVTLFHYDLPQILEDEYHGWLNPKIVDDFTAFADVCFREFGDRVSHWTTLNEPNVFVLGGYDQGANPPRRCSYPYGNNCSDGDSVLEPYIVGHHCLLAHSSAVSLYKRKYQAKQQGLIGLNIFMYHILPLANSTLDVATAKRVQDFTIGWFLNPLVYGDYPDVMKKFASAKLPRFSKSQLRQLINSFDFIGVNYYDTIIVEDNFNNIPLFQRDFMMDLFASGKEINGSDPEAKILGTAHGFQGLLEYLKNFYGNPPVYIHENGYPMPHNSSLDDIPRVKYLSVHFGALLNALRNGSNIKGYFAWSFMDVYELVDAYRTSYGFYYVDFEDKDLKRYPKLSAQWYSNFLKKSSSSCKLISGI